LMVAAGLVPSERRVGGVAVFLGSDDTTTGSTPVQSGRLRRLCAVGSYSRKAIAMYIGVGTVVLILLVVIVVMMMRGRRV
jgi:hypothetical protein